jgi:hypothetical protein
MIYFIRIILAFPKISEIEKIFAPVVKARMIEPPTITHFKGYLTIGGVESTTIPVTAEVTA